jgi:hypothetical protein
MAPPVCIPYPAPRVFTKVSDIKFCMYFLFHALYKVSTILQKVNFVNTPSEPTGSSPSDPSVTSAAGGQLLGLIFFSSGLMFLAESALFFLRKSKNY